jgi:hypothetical protein
MIVLFTNPGNACLRFTCTTCFWRWHDARRWRSSRGKSRFHRKAQLPDPIARNGFFRAVAFRD